MARSDSEFLTIGLFASRVSAVVAALKIVIEEHFSHGGLALYEGALDLDSIYVGRPPAGGTHAKRVALFEPKNAPTTTAMVSNLEDGWMTMVNALAKRLPGTHLLARTSVDDYPITDLEIWVEGQSVRYVRAMKEDPSWEFYQRGEPLVFEQPDCYEQRRISQRFNRTILFETLKRAGWPVADEEFWRSDLPAWYAAERSA